MHTTKRPRARENRIDGLARNGMDDSRFEPLIFGKRRQYGRQSARKHGFARPRRSHKQNAVTTRSRNLHSALSGRLSTDIAKIRRFNRSRRRAEIERPHSHRAQTGKRGQCELLHASKRRPVAHIGASPRACTQAHARASGECERSMDWPHGAVEPKLPTSMHSPSTSTSICFVAAKIAAAMGKSKPTLPCEWSLAPNSPPLYRPAW